MRHQLDIVTIKPAEFGQPRMTPAAVMFDERQAARDRVTAHIDDLRIGQDQMDQSHMLEIGRLLVDEVNAIYHCGALVNSLFPYGAMRAANVEATLYLLELAGTGPLKQFNHVSTIGIFEGAQRERSGPVSEDEFRADPPPHEAIAARHVHDVAI